MPLDHTNQTLVKESPKNQGKSDDLRSSDGMTIVRVRDQDRHHLPDVHRRGENERTELLHLGVDKPLAANRCSAERGSILDEAWMSRGESQRISEPARENN